MEPSCLEIAWKKAGSDQTLNPKSLTRATAWFNAHAQVYDNIFGLPVQVNDYLDADTP